MSSDLLALIAGTVLAVGGLSYVLYPLFFEVREVRPDHAEGESERAADDSAIVALREIEFDRATGKLSDSDYAELKAAYSARALRELRGSTQGEGASSRMETSDTSGTAEPLDPIEARVRAFRMTHRECATCGLRPEQDAIYCSTCGGYLDRLCPDCSAVVAEAGAAFCSACGATLSRGRPRAIV